MNIGIQFGDNENELIFNKSPVAFVGDALDDRGNESVRFIQSSVRYIFNIKYLPHEFEIALNDAQFNVDDLADNLPDFSDSQIIIDATTVGFVELLLLCQHMIDNAHKAFSILYLEPKSYSKRQTEQILNFRDFDLSVQTLGYEAIPGYALSINNDYYQKIVFLCGYEAERMDRVIEDSEIVSSQCKCIFGLPAFKPGWEMNAFANNIRVMKGKDLRRDIAYCGSTNPLSVYNKLSQIYSSLDDDAQMFVVPLASKPMAIGACLFLAGKPKERVAVLYDHPQKKAGRGVEVDKWFLFNIII